ncbi:hypothetical protein FB567DRAFT_553964 [Paraphoma chrysanthemicola]|uniref:Secreted protein n=1 Tax=Paraphoma chrysanthemicola TaxID=798071 RepID=A0A8K0VSY5_9PLEO|nr:hypothetical protein FB567DRAFT_553964 [Paraphoma chrysanthemicola]
MYFALFTGLLLTIATQVICSPLHTSAASSVAAPEPTCTLNVLKAPSFDVDCTFKQHTKTATAYTDCGGCALQTQVLGVGLYIAGGRHVQVGHVRGLRTAHRRQPSETSQIKDSSSDHSIGQETRVTAHGCS